MATRSKKTKSTKKKPKSTKKKPKYTKQRPKSAKKSKSKSKECILTNRIDKKRRHHIEILASNPDPFASDNSVSSKTNKTLTKRLNKNKNKRNHNHTYSSYITPNPPKKKRKVNRIHSNTSHSSSDIEILNTIYKQNKSYNNYNGHHIRHTPSKRHSAMKQSYNLYANAVITHKNGYHSTFSTDHSNNSHQNIEIPSPIPFPKEKNRSKLHSIDIHSHRSHSTQSNKSFEERYSQLDQISRRSKSRSPSPTKSQSPFSQMSSKMTEPQDQLVFNLSKQSKQQIAMRAAVTDAKQQIKSKHNKKSKQYSSLNKLFPSNNNKNPLKTYSRNNGGKHRKKKRRLTQQFIAIRGSHLNDLPHPSMTRNGEILTTDLDKSDYQDLMEIKRNEKTERIAEHWDRNLAEFVKETDIMEMEKHKEEEKVEIDLTMDNEEDDEDRSHDIEILNDEDVVILNNDSPYSLKKTREQGRKKWDSLIEDDVYQAQKFEHSWDARTAEYKRIQRKIEEYKKKKEEERKRAEEEERLRKEEKRKEMEALQKAEEMESGSVYRDLKVRGLDDDDYDLIDQIFDLPSNHIVGTHDTSNIEVRVKDLLTLQTGQWLNDEVMNFYMALLQDRNLKRIEDNDKHISVLFMNTFFFTKLSSSSYNYKAVKRWTKKAKLKKKGICSIDSIFELDKFIFPVHVNNIHWCCGCINFKNKKFEYFDSMNGSSTEFFRMIRKYLEDEFKDKLKNDKTKYNLNLNEWENDNHRKNYPQQQNGVDCGVFTSKCADWISDDLCPDYAQSDMQYFRERIMVEIIRGKTLDF